MGLQGFKDFESVRIKATYNIEIAGKTINEGETIAFFDTVQIAGLNEVISTVKAKGGYGNHTHVLWSEVQELKLFFKKGVFSPIQLGLFNNAKLLIPQSNELIITKREYLETDENSQITCKYIPIQNIYVYSENGNKLTFTQSDKVLTLPTPPYTNIIVDYDFIYTGKIQTLKFGQNLFNGFCTLEALTRIKDDDSGKIVTGIIKVPKMQILTGLSVQLGENAYPMIPSFNAVGLPVGERHSEYVCDLTILDENIESDF